MSDQSIVKCKALNSPLPRLDHSGAPDTSILGYPYKGRVSANICTRRRVTLTLLTRGCADTDIGG